MSPIKIMDIQVTAHFSLIIKLEVLVKKYSKVRNKKRIQTQENLKILTILLKK